MTEEKGSVQGTEKLSLEGKMQGLGQSRDYDIRSVVEPVDWGMTLIFSGE